MIDDETTSLDASWNAGRELCEVLKEAQNKWVRGRVEYTSNLTLRAAIYMVHRIMMNGFDIRKVLAPEDVAKFDAAADEAHITVGKYEAPFPVIQGKA